MEGADNEQPKKRSFAKRWTSKIAETGFTPVANIFLERYAAMGLTSSDAMLVIQIISHKWDEDKPFPAFKTLARRMGMTETAVRNHARKLEATGHIRRIIRLGKPNEFDLAPLFEKLEQHQQAARPRRQRRSEDS